ncbi:RNA polymerase sigma factor [Virgisporangium aurantiacum]|uniref:RNA polymerase sigma24 factor n=1 Tax=Virgisporangium aurantiacum TaxID=175570 RepID=A0A8J4E0C8_9ACTN|nr:sigma-70 family RNA polymerase sigma factor [Virgisporangium aurantiacum]GIJ56666.1 RNA polymerase sigma24 factor [Virgisporangium aurantiacum]
MADTGEFDTFYRDTRRRLFTMMYALTGDIGEAQDITQDAYARAWQHWDRVSGYDDAEGWVRTVARRIAISRWRRARNALTAHRRSAIRDQLPGPDPDLVALVTALAALAAPVRTAIVLHHLVDLSVAEVARETGTPEGTVKARLVRGRRALAAALGTENPEDVHVR